MSDDCVAAQAAEDCVHGMPPGTCSICLRPTRPKASQATLNFAAIADAVAELRQRPGGFRTKDVARHESVREALRRTG